MLERPTGPFMENREAYYAFWAELAKIAKRRYHALPEDKGIPVPGTANRNRRKYKNGAGVSANSRVLSHHYADEGEKGQAHRREIKRKERALWLSEWQDEERDEQTAYSVTAWYAGVFGQEDAESWYDYAEDYCETCQGPCEL